MIVTAVIGKVKNYLKKKYVKEKLYVWEQANISIPAHFFKDDENVVVLSMEEFMRIAKELKEKDVLNELTILIPRGKKKVEELDLDEFVKMCVEK